MQEGSPSSKDIAKLLKEGSCDPNDCHGNIDDDIIVAEYFSDDESKKEEKYAQKNQPPFMVRLLMQNLSLAQIQMKNLKKNTLGRYTLDQL